MMLVVRSNFGDDSIALIQALYNKEILSHKRKIVVVYVDTGWSASSWEQRVQQGENFVAQCGFHYIRLQAKTSFSELVIDRKNFPTSKYQWCAGFLKGLPFIEWLDENDPACESLIALPKRQSLYRTQLTEYKYACEYHGERDVWHPLIHYCDQDRDRLVQQAGFACLHHRSLECDPCVNSTVEDRDRMSVIDIDKLNILEKQIKKKLFSQNIQKVKSFTTAMDSFTMGCGDPFGCGL